MHLCYFILYEMHEKQNQNRRRAPRFLCVPRTKDEHLNSECLWIRPATDSPQPFWQAEAGYKDSPGIMHLCKNLARAGIA